jgi:hypothetical protein
MTATNADTLRAAYPTFANGDLAAATQALDPIERFDDHTIGVFLHGIAR